MNKNVRILMVGAGAIGGSTAAFIALAGYDITIVANREEVAEQLRTKGLNISGVLGTHEVIMKAVAKIPELKGLFDIVFIATKAYDMPKVARKLLPFIHDKSLVVAMQNGICTDDLAAIVGSNRTIGCVIGYGASMIERGSLLVTSYGEFIIGGIDKDHKPHLSTIQEILNNVFPTQISDHIFEELYSKLIINSCITSLGAVCGLKLGKMLKIKKARAIFMGIIKEAMNVAKGLKINVPPYAGKLNYYKLIDDKTAWSRFKANLIITVVGHKYRHLKSSSLQSLERGQLTEIDYFNGYIVRKADEIGIDVPINRQLVAMIKKIEAKQLPIQLSNLDDVQI